MTEATPDIEYVLAALQIAGTDSYVFQRRTKDAPTGAGLLNLWGGTVEMNEDPDAAIRREVGEETSLNPEELGLRLVATREGTSLSNPDDKRLRRGYLYAGTVASAEFKVYEGAGSEVLSLSDVASRDDVTLTTRALLPLLTENI